MLETKETKDSKVKERDHSTGYQGIRKRREASGFGAGKIYYHMNLKGIRLGATNNEILRDWVSATICNFPT